MVGRVVGLGWGGVGEEGGKKGEIHPDFLF